jgi:hypothetical protein
VGKRLALLRAFVVIIAQQVAGDGLNPAVADGVAPMQMAQQAVDHLVSKVFTIGFGNAVLAEEGIAGVIGAPCEAFRIVFGHQRCLP